MTPEEKAKDILDNYIVLIGESVEPDIVKRCALILVEQISHELATQFGKTAVDNEREQFWYDVKVEIIEKL